MDPNVDLFTKPAQVAVWALGDRELVEGVDEATRHIRECEGLRVRLLGEIVSRALVKQSGATSTAAWLDARAHMGVGRARTFVQLADAEARGLCPLVSHALNEGRIGVPQAELIVKFFEKPPAAMDASAIEEISNYLVARAEGEDPKALEQWIQDLRHRLEPVEFERRDAERPEINELFASVTLGGRLELKGSFDQASGEVILTALHSMSKPVPSEDGTPDPRCAAKRRADGLVEIAQHHLDCEHGPKVNGEKPHVLITVRGEDLSAHQAAKAAGEPVPTGLAPARLPFTGLTSLTATAQIACDSVVAAIRLNSDGVPLSMGRSERLVTLAIRKALIVRDRGCAFPGCGRPTAWTDAHHIVHWAAGGPTDLDNLVLLCRHHHTVVHQGRWHVHIGDDQHPWFTPPPWVDPTLTPRPSHHRQHEQRCV